MSITKEQRKKWGAIGGRMSGKLTDEQAEAIRNDTRPASIIAKEYPVTAGQIRRIKRGESRNET